MSSSASASRKRKGPLRLPDGRFMSLAEARALEKPREECNYKDIYEDLSVTKPLSIYFSVTENSLMNGTVYGVNGYGEKPKTPSFREFVQEKPVDKVDKAMEAVGYAQSDVHEMSEAYIRSFVSQNDPALGNYSFGNADDNAPPRKKRKRQIRVEYDMDEQDGKFLEMLNQKREREEDLCEVSKEIFEITMTLLETEWFILERRMPPKTKDPNNANNSELTPSTEEQKCIICDESECDNSNAIVFCDGCDMAVHQECYGVPFIPEGQWLCNKCSISPRHTVSCVFCPNDNVGAFKPTDTGHWAHALCTLWIPEVTVKHPVYMEPVTGLTRIPRGRWKLCCYICKCRMGACIQCANKNCFQAFHPTCAQKASLYMKMTLGAHGAINNPGSLYAYCDNHTPEEHRDQVDVRSAQQYYEDTLDRHAYTGNEWEKLFKGQSAIRQNVKYVRRRANENVRPWRTEKGTPVVPAVIVEKLHKVMKKFQVSKLRPFIQQVSRYWALKRQMKRGAALSKRLQLALEVDPNQQLSQAEAASKLAHYEGLLNDLERLRVLTEQVRQREELKLKVVEEQKSINELVYFPTIYFLRQTWSVLLHFEQNHMGIFTVNGNAQKAKDSLNDKYTHYKYACIEDFVHDLHTLFNEVHKAYGQESEKSKELANFQTSTLKQLIDEAQAKSSSLPRDQQTNLPDFKNFLPSGLFINEDEVWSGARLRREMSPLSDLDDEELTRLEAGTITTNNSESLHHEQVSEPQPQPGLRKEQEKGKQQPLPKKSRRRKWRRHY